jgi:hypothetical protein
MSKKVPLKEEVAWILIQGLKGVRGRGSAKTANTSDEQKDFLHRYVHPQKSTPPL